MNKNSRHSPLVTCHLFNAFTLFELLIVISLISVFYFFVVSNINIKKQTYDNLKLETLKTFMLSQDFEENAVLKCIEDGKKCLLFTDNKQTDIVVEDLFESRPEVYKYSDALDRIFFQDLELEELETYEVCFEYKVNRDGKSDEMIVDTGDNVFIFNAIKNKAEVIKYLNDIPNYFDEKIQEVKDAF